MARVLIGDPYPEIRELLAHIVSSMELEPVFPEELEHGDAADVDLVLLEPGYASTIELAASLRRSRPGLSIVCVSIYPATPEVLALKPAAYLLKPFSVAALQRAIEQALEHADRSQVSSAVA